MSARINAEAHQNQRAQQRENRLFTGQHHHAGLSELAKGVEGNQAAQILNDLNWPREGHWTYVGCPEEITVRSLVHLFQRVFQLAVRDLELSQFQNQRIPALQQGVQQFALGAQLGFQNTVLLAGQRLSVSLTDLAYLRLLIEKIFKVQSLHAQLGHLGIQLLRFRHFR